MPTIPTSKTPTGTTLIKYYNFIAPNTTGENTCYDGKKEFTKPHNAKRFYPDEYLIAHILNKYISTKKLGESLSIITLIEPWQENGGKREGGSNVAINSLILEKINQTENRPDLILVPFLYGYHHPGIAIDMINKKVIYVDPKGGEQTYGEEEREELKRMLKDFSYAVVNKAQQGSDDGTSCGPVLTSSMIKFIDEFIADRQITPTKFASKSLASERMQQMYINNTIPLQDETGINEIMLADQGLWLIFITKKQADFPPITLKAEEVLNCIQAQQQYIQALDENWEKDTSAVEKVKFIKNFQSEITALLLNLNENNLEKNVDAIRQFNRQSAATFNVKLEQKKPVPEKTKSGNIDNFLTEAHNACGQLRELCDEYELTLKKINTKKSADMQVLITLLKSQLDDKTHPNDLDKINQFSAVLMQSKPKFSIYRDPDTGEFIKRVIKILATILISIPTLGIIAAAMALYGCNKKGHTTYFWVNPTETEKFKQKVDGVLRELKEDPELKLKRIVTRG